MLFASGLSGTITLAGQVPIYEAIQVLGPGAAQITVNGGGTSRIFGVYPWVNGSYGDPVTISGLTMTNGHSADAGGAIYANFTQLTVADAVLSGNTSGGPGGGISALSTAVDPGSLTVRSSTVSGNTAGGGSDYGGGIWAYTPVLIENSTLSGNSGYSGAGVFSSYSFPGYAASVTVRNSTISSNSGAGESNSNGGGIRFCCGEGGEQLTLESSTISGNSAAFAGGVISSAYSAGNPTATTQIVNSILANNTATRGDVLGPEIYASSGANVSFSLIENTSNSTGAGYSLSSPGPNLFGIDPQLQPLAGNGGPTQTHALAPSSPALDKGSTGLAGDQRGSTRPFDFAATTNAAGGNGADIGAFELAPNCQGRAPTIVARAGQTTVGTAGADVIVGTDRRDVINAGKGKDTVCGRAGNDKTSGGKGNDKLDGNKGKDKLSGQAGKDRLRGGKGKDTLKGGKGRDTLKGGPGRDRLFGGPQRDKLAGGAGKDTQKQ